jgi:hypothetical protein
MAPRFLTHAQSTVELEYLVPQRYWRKQTGPWICFMSMRHFCCQALAGLEAPRQALPFYLSLSPSRLQRLWHPQFLRLLQPPPLLPLGQSSQPFLLSGSFPNPHPRHFHIPSHSGLPMLPKTLQLVQFLRSPLRLRSTPTSSNAFQISPVYGRLRDLLCHASGASFLTLDYALCFLLISPYISRFGFQTDVSCSLV